MEQIGEPASACGGSEISPASATPLRWPWNTEETPHKQGFTARRTYNQERADTSYQDPRKAKGYNHRKHRLRRRAKRAERQRNAPNNHKHCNDRPKHVPLGGDIHAIGIAYLSRDIIARVDVTVKRICPRRLKNQASKVFTASHYSFLPERKIIFPQAPRHF